jgi:hypothetical protein
MNVTKASWLKIGAVVVGVTMLVAAVRLLTKEAAAAHAQNWTPLVLPVSLRTGAIRTPQVQIDRDGDYEIVLDLNHKFGINKMQCLLGAADADSNRCAGIPNLIDISWKLFEGDVVVTSGTSHDMLGLTWSDTVKRYLGRFKGQRGHQYVLVLDVNRDASELDVAQPKLMVEAPYGVFKDYGVGVAIQRTEATVMGVIGIIVLAGVFFLQVNSRK